MSAIVIEDARNAPGNVQLIDAEGNLKTKHASVGDHEIVLIPTPSDDPEDPLNWSNRRKMLATSCVVVFVSLPGFKYDILTINNRYTLMITIPSSAVYSVTAPISKQTSLTVDDLIAGTGAMARLIISHNSRHLLTSHSSCSLAGAAYLGNIS